MNASSPSAQAAPSSSPDLELTITRVFNAPRERVFAAWTDPDQTRRWGGPAGFTATSIQGEVRPGGPWRTCLRNDATGEELWQGGVYREVVPPELLVFTFAWDGDDGRPEHESLISLRFAEEAGKTTMTFHQGLFASTPSRDGHQKGWNSAFDRLAVVVEAA